jgi:hypothetical protein
MDVTADVAAPELFHRLGAQYARAWYKSLMRHVIEWHGQHPRSIKAEGVELLYTSNEMRASMASLSPNAEKLFKAMKQGGYLSEEKTASAEKITALSKLPKAQCMNAIQELEKSGHVKKKKKNVDVSYYLLKTDLE